MGRTLNLGCERSDARSHPGTQMSKIISVSLLTIIIISAVYACAATSASEPPLSTPEPASVSQPSQTAGQTPSVSGSPTNDPGAGVQQTVAVPAGLRVVYLREGNLWSWTETGGNVLLTDTGDMSTARLSPDGQLLALMRGREVWTVRMDGTDARLWIAQANEGGALWFAPNGSLLAVSTKDHIDVVDLQSASSITVVAYPALPEGYFPEVVWAPDASGFKTVVPPQTDIGQAELLFVFPSGTVASLSKFAITSLAESQPFLSPDGGYVIYAAELSEGKKSLYLMDSSGATRPYGEPAGKVRAVGWLPDSKHFVYTLEDFTRVFMGDVAGLPVEIRLDRYQIIRWVDAEHFLALQAGGLYLGDIHGGKRPIDVNVSDFDFRR